MSLFCCGQTKELGKNWFINTEVQTLFLVLSNLKTLILKTITNLPDLSVLL
jgi:hypothetical protein